MTRRFVESSNIVEFDRYVYATLDNIEPSSSIFGFEILQEEFLEMPLGWELASDEPDVIENVVAQHPWGALCLLVKDSNFHVKAGYYTKQAATPGQLAEKSDKDLIERKGNAYKPAWMIGIARASCARILIRSPFSCKRRRCESSNIMAGMWKDKSFCDLTILCDSRTIKCHRAVLAQGSPVFERMLQCPMKEAMAQEIKIMDADPDALERMIQFLYIGVPSETQISIEDTLMLLVLADRYQVESLFEHSIRMAFSSLDCDNAASIVRTFRQFAQRPEMQVLWTRLCNDIARNPKVQAAVLMKL